MNQAQRKITVVTGRYELGIDTPYQLLTLMNGPLITIGQQLRRQSVPPRQQIHHKPARGDDVSG